MAAILFVNPCPRMQIARIANAREASAQLNLTSQKCDGDARGLRCIFICTSLSRLVLRRQRGGEIGANS
jgi:hypothetical protein